MNVFPLGTTSPCLMSAAYRVGGFPAGRRAGSGGGSGRGPAEGPCGGRAGGRRPRSPPPRPARSPGRPRPARTRSDGRCARPGGRRGGWKGTDGKGMIMVPRSRNARGLRTPYVLEDPPSRGPDVRLPKTVTFRRRSRKGCDWSAY